VFDTKSVLAVVSDLSKNNSAQASLTISAYLSGRQWFADALKNVAKDTEIKCNNVILLFK
jgi:hypothetical protein